jgi:hypothetical protein
MPDEGPSGEVDGPAPHSLDITGSLRGTVAIEQLVRWVLQTDPKNELDWLEWKVGTDLATKDGQFAVAKQILGFGNRDPERAAVHAEGCAFVVLGAEPGKLGGQTPIDHADLEAGLRRYVGTTGPQWTPLWVTVEDAQVLVIVVEPPRFGDHMHALARQFGSFPEGQIFIRRQGGTHAPNIAEIRMLEDRLTARPVVKPLALLVEVVGEPLVPLDIGDEAIEEWIDKERAMLLVPLIEDERKKAKPVAPNSLVSETIMSIASAAAAVEAATWSVEREERSPDEFRAQVEQYLEVCRDRLGRVAASDFVDDEWAMLSLAIENPSERNLPKVELTVTLEGPVDSFDEWGRLGRDLAYEDEGLPRRPRSWGPRKIELGLNQALLSNIARAPGMFPPIAPSAPEFRSRNHGSTTIVFAAVDMRPYARVDMPAVPLLFLTDIGDAIVGSWAATSTGFDGVASGAIEIPVSKSQPVRPTNLSL